MAGSPQFTSKVHRAFDEAERLGLTAADKEKIVKYVDLVLPKYTLGELMEALVNQSIQTAKADESGNATAMLEAWHMVFCVKQEMTDRYVHVA